MPHKRQSCHFQVRGPPLEYIATLLGGATARVASVCPCDGGALTACVDRLKLGSDRPKADPRVLRAYKKAMGAIYSQYGHIPSVPFNTVINTYGGTKRAMYTYCAELYHMFGLGKMYFLVFGKPGERNPLTKIRSRAIVPQVSKYEGVTQPQFTPILVELAGGRFAQERMTHNIRNSDGTPMFTCGMDNRQIARVIVDALAAGYVVISLDISSFDGSLGELASIERRAFYETTDKWSDLDRVLQAQEESELHCRSFKARIPGIRQSGTAGTGIANKMCMASILKAAMGPSGNKLLVAGDDALAFVSPEAYTTSSQSWLKRMQKLGLGVTVEDDIRLAFTMPATTVGEVVFCRSKVVITDSGPLLVKLPEDALVTAMNITRHARSPQFADYIHTVGVGYTHLWPVPILYKIARMLASVEGRNNEWLLGNSGLDYCIKQLPKGGTIAEYTPTEGDRIAYYQTTGIAPQTQSTIEDLIDCLAPVYRDEVHEHCARLLRREPVFMHNE